MDKKARFITVYPVLSGNGAKFVATNFAHTLKTSNSKRRVALVDFNLKHPYLAYTLTTHDDIHGLDNLIDKIDGNMLTQELFEQNMVVMKNKVEVLKGTKLIGKHKVFTEKHMEAILYHLGQIYDDVVISVAPEPDNAGTVLGLHYADTVVMVARNTVANVKMAPFRKAIIDQYRQSQEPVKLVYNMNASSSLDLSEFVKSQGIEVIGSLEFDEAAVDNIDLANQGARLFKSKSRNQDAFVSMVKSL